MMESIRHIATATLLTSAMCGSAKAQTPAEDGPMLSSPDGRWHVFERRSEKGTQIWIHGMAGEALRPLVSLPGHNRHMAWSPDSHFLAFCATFHGRRFITVSDLTGHSWLVAEISGECNTPVWSPDASQLAFSSRTRSGDTDVYLASAGGTLHRNLTRSAVTNENVRAWHAGTALPEIRTFPLE